MNEIKIVPDVYKSTLSKIDFWIYGNGNIAEEAYIELEKYNCKNNIQGVMIGSEYWTEGLRFHDYNVKKYCEDESYENLFVAIDPIKHSAVINSFIDNKNINKIYIYYSSKLFRSNQWVGFGSQKCFFIDTYYTIAIKRGLDNEYYFKNKEKFNQTFSWLSDEKSRKIMECYITGHKYQKNYPLYDMWTQKDIYDQYFPSFLNLSNEEVVMDCGAYNGDTFRSYIYHIGSFKKYYAFEPDRNIIGKLKANTMFYPNVQVISKGVSDHIGEIGFDIMNGCGKISNQSSDIIKITTIDEEVTDNITFIKMDIEGAELEALRGGSETIKRNKPKLAICVYHKREDLITIPEYIKKLHPDYRLFLRAHEPTLSEVVLYAI